jgi:hypothetical protein
MNNEVEVSGSEVIGRDVVSGIEYSTDESAAKYRDT